MSCLLRTGAVGRARVGPTELAVPPWEVRSMRTPLSNRRGFALEATLIFLVLLTALLAAGIAAMVMVQRSAGVDYRGSRVTYAAEAAADHVMSQLANDISDGIISNAELAAITPPTVAGFKFTPPTTTRDSAVVPKVLRTGTFKGLYGLNQKIDIRTTASDTLGNQSTVVVTVNAQSIPLFQFGAFYQGDLEIHNGPPMYFDGWVHTNGNLYLSSANTFFKDMVTSADSVIWRRKDDNSPPGSGVFIDNASGVPVALTFDNRTDPGSSFNTKSNVSFSGRLMSISTGVDTLNLPLPAGTPPTAMVDERDVADPSEVRNVKFAWKADLHIVVDASKLGLTPAQFCDPISGGIVFDRGGRPVPDAATCARIFTPNGNAFRDGRENVGVDVVDINVDSLENWVADPASGAKKLDILYLTFDPATITRGTPYDTTRSRSDYPAIRLTNGAILQFPLTVATDAPIYVWGNYNSNLANWQPASILGDAVTFLSGNWADSNHAWVATWVPDPTINQPLANPVLVATPTSVYAAIAAGHSATPCDVNRAAPPCNPADSAPPPLSATNYGGGLENFPRFLENWAGRTMTYRGSLVSLFNSRYADRRRWAWTYYYNPPARDWRFDLRFRDPSQLPPGTPTVGNVSQIAYRPVY